MSKPRGVKFIHSLGRTCTGNARSVLAPALALLLVGCPGPPSDGAPRGDADHGRRLLARYHCGSCHTIPGVEAAHGQVAVTLESFGRRSYIAGRVPNDNENLIRWIADPQSVVPGTLMPNMGASPADARDMAAFLGTLR